MAKTFRTCRVCGKSYEACHTAKVSNNFRWQDVSCSPECGAEYLRRIMVSRNELTKEKVEDASVEPEIVEDEEFEEESDDFEEDPE